MTSDATYIPPFIPSDADRYYNKLLAAANAEVERLRGALREIEGAHPAGSSWSLMNDGTWREACRDLQRIARVALRETTS